MSTNYELVVNNKYRRVDNCPAGFKQYCNADETLPFTWHIGKTTCQRFILRVYEADMGPPNLAAWGQFLKEADNDDDYCIEDEYGRSYSADEMLEIILESKKITFEDREFC